MDLEKNKQRLEILAAELEELKRNGGGGGTATNYNDLTNKPSINNQVLTGNKSLSDLGAATPSDITEAFAPSGITIAEGGTFPSGSRALLAEHKPINVNDDQYYFLEETGVDYLYGSLPTSGAFPSLSYFRVMKQSFAVEFHDIAIDTAPTEDSDNLITSGGVYTALQSAGGGVPAYVNMPTGSNAYFPEDKMEILEKHLPFTTTSSPTDISPVYLFIGCYGNYYIYREFGEQGFIAEVSIHKNTRKITSTSKDGGGIIYDVNSANYMRYVLTRPDDTLSGENNMYKQILYITGAVDLNNSPYFQPKMVVCQSDATAATLTNCPTVKAFYMLIDNYAQRPTQTIFEVENPAVFYRRNRIDTSTWTAWYKFEGTAVV